MDLFYIQYSCAKYSARYLNVNNNTSDVDSSLGAFYSWTVHQKNTLGPKLLLIIVRWDFHHCNRINKSWTSDFISCKRGKKPPSECRFLMNIASSLNSGVPPPLPLCTLPAIRPKFMHTQCQNTTGWSVVFRCLICVLNDVEQIVPPPHPTLYVFIYLFHL